MFRCRFGASKVSIEDVEAFARHQTTESKKPLTDSTNKWVIIKFARGTRLVLGWAPNWD